MLIGRFPRNQIHRNLIEASPTGAVWALDVASGRAWVVASGLVMPNGVSLTHREDALLVTVCACYFFVQLLISP
jgi:sugar lactone lactonase YvrE